MSAYQEAERLLASLTPAEKARLLQAVARELDYSDPGVERASDMCGGEACIVRTRIPAWTLEQARRLGATDAKILEMYPSLRAENLTNAWAYVRSHREEIDRQIVENEAA